MRLLRALKAPSRFLILAPLFGVAVALIVIARYPGSVSAGETQRFPNQVCSSTTCQAITGSQGTCAVGLTCNFTGQVAFSTCQPTGQGCINDQDLYGYINCVGTCSDNTGTNCNQNIYLCSISP